MLATLVPQVIVQLLLTVACAKGVGNGITTPPPALKLYIARVVPAVASFKVAIVAVAEPFVIVN